MFTFSELKSNLNPFNLLYHVVSISEAECYWEEETWAFALFSPNDTLA